MSRVLYIALGILVGVCLEALILHGLWKMRPILPKGNDIDAVEFVALEQLLKDSKGDSTLYIFNETGELLLDQLMKKYPQLKLRPNSEYPTSACADESDAKCLAPIRWGLNANFPLWRLATVDVHGGGYGLQYTLIKLGKTWQIISIAEWSVN